MFSSNNPTTPPKGKKGIIERESSDSKQLVAQSLTMNLWKIIENKFFSSLAFLCYAGGGSERERENGRGKYSFSQRHKQKNIAERKLHNSANVTCFYRFM